ncbi:hypothetical protein AMTR_s00010p00260340 [Amborella trichopoda]|uniref:Glutathione S-transferase n=1 Tax=Amborella trichopoda TaxID=13333 RepID=W1NF75_AMBTC|nr:hypothetical protein AMTR_s00010p00260340 [Amborella trichopoda]
MASPEVKLFGIWASSFCVRIELVLKLKGIACEYTEEDLSNKSQLLLQLNPIHKKLVICCDNILASEGKEQEKAVTEFTNSLEVLDQGLLKDFRGGLPVFNGERRGFSDLVLSCSSGWHKVLEEIAGVKVIEAERNPTLYSWRSHFFELNVVKDTFPSHEKLLSYAKNKREKVLHIDTSLA